MLASLKIYSNKVSILAVLILIVLLTACGNSSSASIPVQSPLTPIIEVIPFNSTPEKRRVSTEIVPQNNCLGTAEVTNQIERSRSITRVIELQGSISVNGNGEVGVPGFGNVQIGAEVAAVYGFSYGVEESISRSLTVTARDGTNISHEIQQVEYWQTGTVVIKSGDQEIARYPYKFRTDFGLEYIQAINNTCPVASVVGAAPSVATPSIEATSTSAINKPTVPPVSSTPLTTVEPRNEQTSTLSINKLIGEWQTIWVRSGKPEPLIIRIVSTKVGAEAATFGYVYADGNQCRTDAVYTGFDGEDHIFSGRSGFGAAIRGGKLNPCSNVNQLVYRIRRDSSGVILRQSDSGNEFSVTTMTKLTDLDAATESFPVTDLLGDWQTRWKRDGKEELLGIRIVDVASNTPSGSMAYLYAQPPQCRIDISYAGYYEGSHIFFGYTGNGVSVQGKMPSLCINANSVTYKISYDGTNFTLQQYDNGGEFSSTILERP